MEKSDSRSEEETYLWVPLQCLDQTLKAILKCLGLFHQDSLTTTKTASSPGTSNQPEEEEEDATVKEEVVVASRAIKVKAKKRGKESVSSGRPGKHN